MSDEKIKAKILNGMYKNKIIILEHSLAYGKKWYFENQMEAK